MTIRRHRLKLPTLLKKKIECNFIGLTFVHVGRTLLDPDCSTRISWQLWRSAKAWIFILPLSPIANLYQSIKNPKSKIQSSYFAEKSQIKFGTPKMTSPTSPTSLLALLRSRTIVDCDTLDVKGRPSL